jgi:hypothetical protein
VPFGNSGAEDFVLGQTTAFGSGVAKEYKKSTQKKRQRDLMNYMAEMGRQQQISNTSLPTTYDPNVVDEKEVRLVSMGRGQKPHPAVVSKQNDLNMLKDMATFAAKDPNTFKNVFALSMLQSPVKAVGAIGEATWARGNDNYQNDLSKQFFNSVNQDSIESWKKQKNIDDPTTGMGQSLSGVKTGSYDDKMKRIEAFMMNQEIIKSMEPDFTSDFTAGDAADTASWFIPGPGMLGKFAKTGVKTGVAVGKTIKDARIALAASKAAPRARPATSTFSGLGGTKTKLAVGAGVGAAVYGSQEEDADAFPGSSIVKAVEAGDLRGANNILKNSLRGRVRGDALRNGLSRASDAIDFSNFGRTFKRPTSARDSSTLAAKQEMWDSQPDLLERWNIFSTKNPNWSASGDEIHHGHINARSKGGSTSPNNWEYMTKEANDAIGDRDLNVFVKDEMKKTNLPLAEALAEVKNRWSFNHIPDNVLLGARA